VSLTEKIVSFSLVLLSLALLYPGISKPVMTITGTLDKAGMVELGQQAVIDAKVQKALEANPGRNEAKLRRSNARNLRLLSGLLDLDRVSGRAEVYRKSSSVQQTVRSLLDKGYLLVAGLVALFSVIIPVLKNLMLVVAVAVPTTRAGQLLRQAALLLGKWSMADVFLVALFVGFLAFDATSAMNGVLEMDAAVEPGLYWFAGYCVVSILAGQLISFKLAAADIAETSRPKKTRKR